MQLPTGLQLQAKTISAPLVIEAAGGGAVCYHNILRDNLLQSYHQYVFAGEHLVRGGGHFLLADGGAGAAGMSLEHSGAADLVYFFGVSGAFELLLAAWMLYIALRQPALIGLGLWTQIAKSGLVLLLGYALKPPVGPPPGLIPDLGTLILAALGLAALVLARRSGV